MDSQFVFVGDPGKFAIECFLAHDSPPFGTVRLWLDGSHLGEYQESMFLYDMCLVLRSLKNRKTQPSEIVFRSESDVPPLQDLILQGGWSFGENFDSYWFVYYAVLSSDQIHWRWKHPSYGVEVDETAIQLIRHAAVPGGIFDSVVSDFLERLSILD